MTNVLNNKERIIVNKNGWDHVLEVHAVAELNFELEDAELKRSLQAQLSVEGSQRIDSNKNLDKESVVNAVISELLEDDDEYKQWAAILAENIDNISFSVKEALIPCFRD